jgi:gamma-glutamylcyclotransferase (GGCT)/AIG2-like uncharacterized protein YtfP
MGAPRFYFAYGANTHREHMARRCPAAKSVGRVKLYGHSLAFRGVADVIRKPGAVVHGALWEITPECERSLDAFEGFPRLYVKRTATLKMRGRDVRVMFYVMRQNDERFSPPPRSYEDVLRAGYAHFGLKSEQIDAAIAHALKIDAEPAFVSKWHRIDRGEDVRPVARVPAKARPNAPASREPVPQAWEQWRFESFDERLRRARASALPAMPSQVEAARKHFARAGNNGAKLLAVPVGTTLDIFEDVRRLRRGAK